ncbi:hypothetical protein [Ruegeria arenilitoris]|uniref:hypothetical protein n=1 Tax=Ruegeria arenilitoris TaxID=1173585 RepID=UPI001C2B7FA2|nr:hypothetical protein [Ruegeria arenilitoris]
MTKASVGQKGGTSMESASRPDEISQDDALLYASQYMNAPMLNHFKSILANVFSHLPLISPQRRQKFIRSANKRNTKILSSAILNYKGNHTLPDDCDIDAELLAEIHKKMRSEFDENYYVEHNEGLDLVAEDPFLHFVTIGWREGRNPNAWFDCQAYYMCYPDVALAGVNPFEHYITYGRREGRELPDSSILMPNLPRLKAKYMVQDNAFKQSLENAEKILVILIPEHNEMSGGIFSFFSIANAAYKLRHRHNFEIVLMTRPNKMGETYLRQRNFRNSEDVFRFEQIVRCKNAKTVYINIPEYAAPEFVDSLNNETLEYLETRDNLFINILNQKTDIMPEPCEYEDLRALSDQLTQSVAHHAYFGQSFADHYGTPMLLLPAYTDLSNYEAVPQQEKEKLIIYSPDEAPWKQKVLDVLAAGLPDYELLKIEGITFDAFMDLASKCRYSVTFGEGFDGYLAQPIYQGGVAFAVYNDEFFPSERLRDFYNIFQSEEEMVQCIVDRIHRMDEDPELYRLANDKMMTVYDDLYSRDDYLRRIEMLIKREFELQPLYTESWSQIIKL